MESLSLPPFTHMGVPNLMLSLVGPMHGPSIHTSNVQAAGGDGKAIVSVIDSVFLLSTMHQLRGEGADN